MSRLTMGGIEVLSRKKYHFSSIALFIYVISVFTLSYQTDISVISQLIGVALVSVFVIETLMIKNYRFYVPLPLITQLLFLLILIISIVFLPGDFQIAFTVFQIIILFFITVNIIVFTGNTWPITIGALIGTILLNYQAWSFLGGTFDLEGQRIPNEFLNANAYATYLSIGILISMYVLLKLRAGEIQASLGGTWILRGLLYLVIIVYSYLIITLSGSRGGFIAIFFLFTGYGAYILKNSKWIIKFLYLLIIPIALFFGSKSLLTSVGYTRLFNVDSSISTRKRMIFDAIQFWSEKPYLGWGLDQFRNISGYDTYSHNNVVELLANNGLIGCITYYGIYVAIFFMVLKAFLSKKQNQRFTIFWCVLALITLLSRDIGDVSYYSKDNGLVISMVVGLLIVHSNPSRKPAI